MAEVLAGTMFSRETANIYEEYMRFSECTVVDCTFQPWILSLVFHSSRCLSPGNAQWKLRRPVLEEVGVSGGIRLKGRLGGGAAESLSRCHFHGDAAGLNKIPINRQTTAKLVSVSSASTTSRYQEHNSQSSRSPAAN
ncbi:hypothetical protein MHYP_G00185020 [Metynnis hypsauchen]